MKAFQSVVAWLSLLLLCGVQLAACARPAARDGLSSLDDSHQLRAAGSAGDGYDARAGGAVDAFADEFFSTVNTLRAVNDSIPVLKQMLTIFGIGISVALLIALLHFISDMQDKDKWLLLACVVTALPPLLIATLDNVLHNHGHDSFMHFFSVFGAAGLVFFGYVVLAPLLLWIWVGVAPAEDVRPQCLHKLITLYGFSMLAWLPMPLTIYITKRVWDAVVWGAVTLISVFAITMWAGERIYTFRGEKHLLTICFVLVMHAELAVLYHSLIYSMFSHDAGDASAPGPTGF